MTALDLLQALLGFAAAPLPGFRVFFDVSLSGRHAVAPSRCMDLGGCSLSKRP